MGGFQFPADTVSDVGGGTQQPQQSQQPQQADPYSQLKETLAQQAMPKAKPSGGPIRQLLQNFIGGMGQSMMHQAGLPTELQQRQMAMGNLVNLTNAESMAGMRQALIQRDLLNAQATQSNLQPMSKDMAAQFGHPEWAGLTMGQALGIAAKTLPVEAKPLTVSGVGAFQGAAGGFQPIAGTQSAQPVVDHDTAMLAGVPQLEGQPANEATWKTLNSALTAKGLKVQDMGQNGPGENQGMWLMNRAGTKIKQVSPNSLMWQRGASFAQSRAAVTPFETVVPGTNIPQTISNLQAVKTGAPKIPLGTQKTLGGQYALFKDAYGILDQVNNLADKVNLDDPAVAGRIAAGYAAIKDPAGQGLGRQILGNILARQPINRNLTANERQLVLLMAQGKAAGMGFRGIMGQAGVNELQQSLDSALMPGPTGAASKAAFKQQVSAARGLLNRFEVGQPQVGLNAPGAPSALQNIGGSAGGANRIPVVRLSDGQSGSILEQDFDPAKYKRK